MSERFNLPNFGIFGEGEPLVNIGFVNREMAFSLKENEIQVYYLFPGSKELPPHFIPQPLGEDGVKLGEVCAILRKDWERLTEERIPPVGASSEWLQNLEELLSNEGVVNHRLEKIVRCQRDIIKMMTEELLKKGGSDE